MIDEAKDRELFHAIAAGYGRKDVVASSRIAREAMLRRAVQPIVSRRGGLGTVVEIGCGVGASALYLAGSFDRYVGLDYAPAMIDMARALTTGQSAGAQAGVEFVNANAKATGLAAASADTILMVGALHHMDDIPEVMAEMRRIAKPGATLIAMEPQRGNPVIQLARRLRARIDPNYSAEQHFFSRAELAAIFAENGFTAVRLRYFSILAQPFAQVVLNPQAVFAPLSRLCCRLDPVLEAILPGPLCWLIVSEGVFP